MRCKLCRRGRQEGRVGPLLYFILLLLSGKLQNGRKMVHPTFGAMRQVQKDLFHLNSVCPLGHGFPRLPPQLPLHSPTRAHYARVRRFSLFAFTSSPQGRKNLCINDLQVKASPLFPSPVKAKKGTILHTQNTLYQRIAGEGEG